MPTVINVGSVVQCNAVYLIDGQTNINTFFYRVDGDVFEWPDQAEPIADDFISRVCGTIGEMLGGQNIQGYATVQPVYPTRYRAFRKDTVYAGVVGALPLPTGVAAVIRRQGPLANRRNQGRIYIGGVADTYVTESALNAQGLAAAEGIRTAILETIPIPGTAAVLTPIIFNLAAPQNDVVPEQAVTDPVIRYQRRRELRVGI